MLGKNASIKELGSSYRPPWLLDALVVRCLLRRPC